METTFTPSKAEVEVAISFSISGNLKLCMCSFSIATQYFDFLILMCKSESEM